MQKKNSDSLKRAMKEKNDEFYTMLYDIENELKNYRKQFENKIILMPCDDPELIKNLPDGLNIEDQASKFWVFFHKNFKFLKLKKIIATHFNEGSIAYKIEYDGSGNDENIYEFKKTHLIGDGDFRNDEVQLLYDESDLIITNPPFSLFREFAANIIKKQKKYLIIGNQLVYGYNDFFPYFRDNLMKSGYTYPKEFIAFDKKTNKAVIKKFGNVCWFTNLDTSAKEEFIPFKKYKEEDYKFYDNDKKLLNIDRIKEIPCNYNNLMAIPITILNYNYQKHFKLLELRKDLKIDGKYKFVRIVAERK